MIVAMHHIQVGCLARHHAGSPWFTTYLRECGYTVDEADGSAGALERLAADTFDAVVSDLVMPGAQDGLGLAHEVRRRWPEIPVLLVSGYATTLHEARAANIPTLAKPFALPALAETVASLLAAEPRPVGAEHSGPG